MCLLMSIVLLFFPLCQLIRVQVVMFYLSIDVGGKSKRQVGGAWRGFKEGRIGLVGVCVH
jgi:hypothetical protein